MDKKGEPKSIRFRIHAELKMEEIAIKEGKPFCEILDDIIDIGLHEYEFVTRHFHIGLKYHDD